MTFKWNLLYTIWYHSDTILHFRFFQSRYIWISRSRLEPLGSCYLFWAPYFVWFCKPHGQWVCIKKNTLNLVYSILVLLRCIRNALIYTVCPEVQAVNINQAKWSDFVYPYISSHLLNWYYYPHTFWRLNGLLYFIFWL